MSEAKVKVIKLSKPIVRGDKEFFEIILNEPRTIALKGLALLDVLRCETGAMKKLIERISTPRIVEGDYINMPVRDWSDLSLGALSFFNADSDEENSEEDNVEATGKAKTGKKA